MRQLLLSGRPWASACAALLLESSLLEPKESRLNGRRLRLPPPLMISVRLCSPFFKQLLNSVSSCRTPRRRPFFPCSQPFHPLCPVWRMAPHLGRCVSLSFLLREPDLVFSFVHDRVFRCPVRTTRWAPSHRRRQRFSPRSTSPRRWSLYALSRRFSSPAKLTLAFSQLTSSTDPIPPLLLRRSVASQVESFATLSTASEGRRLNLPWLLWIRSKRAGWWGCQGCRKCLGIE